MADVWVVMAHIGPGEVIGAYTTQALAQAALGAKPSVNYDIVLCTIDADIGFVVQQNGGPVIANSQGIGAPRHVGVRNGRTR